MERLQKVMAHCGVASRRKCEEIILEGRVKVNGKTVTELGTKINKEKDRIEVDGVLLTTEEKPVYIVLNKPKGYLSTAEDPKGRKTVMGLVENISERIYPVGRLDYDTEGLLLLTNDGNLSYALTHPSHKVKKTYIVEVEDVPGESELQTLREGIELEDGITAPAEIEHLKSGKTSELSITIHEGRKRQVRRMFSAIGYPVLNLKRIRLGPLTLKGIPVGSYREPNEKELNDLEKIKKQALSREDN